MADDHVMNPYRKLALCTALILICLVVIGGVNLITYSEYFFSHPPKRDIERHLPMRNLPAFSSAYFRYYSYSWVVFFAVLFGSAWLIIRKQTTLEDIALLGVYSLLGTATIVTLTTAAIYFANQTFVFKGQHLL